MLRKYKKMFLLRFLSWWPLPLLYLFSDFLYLLAAHLFRYRRKVILENLHKSFPEKSEKEIRQIARKFYRHLCDLTVETIKIPHLSEKQFRKRVKFLNIDLPCASINQGKSILTLTGHTCNWEWLLLAWSIHVPQPVYGIYKPMHIQSLDKLFLRMRSRFGARPVAMKDTYREIIRTKNEVKCIALVADQTPPEGEIQHFTTFLNQRTAFFVGADKIVQRTNYPAFYVAMRRVKRGYYEVEFLEIPKPQYPSEGFPLIDAFATLLENHTRQNPSDWLWSHRRWKHKDFKKGGHTS